MKKCTKCGVEKELIEFYKRNLKEISICIQCVKKYRKDYELKNKETIKQKSKEHYIKNAEKIKENSRRYKLNNKDKIKEYREANKDKISKTKKEYEQKNKHKRNERVLNRLKNDLNFKIKYKLRNRLYQALKDINKSASTMDLLGCTIEEFKIYIESLFQFGMTWENYSFYGWHIDHIRPCCTFNLVDPEQQRQCFHYLNLQPMWSKENWSKNGKWVDTQQNYDILME